MDLIKNNQVSVSHSKTTTEQPRKMTQSYYTVLIASSANGIIESLKQKEILNYQVRETLKKDVREYTIGQLENLSEAMELQTLARSSGYKGAFVQLETIQIISKEKHSDIKLKFAGVN